MWWSVVQSPPSLNCSSHVQMTQSKSRPSGPSVRSLILTHPHFRFRSHTNALSLFQFFSSFKLPSSPLYTPLSSLSLSLLFLPLRAGNIAGDCISLRNTVIEAGVLLPICECVDKWDKISQVRTAGRCLSLSQSLSLLISLCLSLFLTSSSISLFFFIFLLSPLNFLLIDTSLR